MAKAEWGIKRTCPSCQAKFYDLRKSPIHCPKCDAEIDPNALIKKKRGRPSAAELSAKKAIVPEVEIELLEEDDVVLVLDDEETLDEDADFGGDDDLVAPVKKNSDED